jgi:methylated-DNA-[protein]-cysteine S-methyltransferase
MQLNAAELETPIGTLMTVGGTEGLCAVAFDGGAEEIEHWLARRFGPVELRSVATLPKITAPLKAYFAGDLEALERIPVDTGGTAFQREVWLRLRKVRAGSTVAYGELARAIGRPAATRAVAAANAHNPIPIVVPCHRVIAADGSLWGYGGGLDRKRWLLRHEGAIGKLLSAGA